MNEVWEMIAPYIAALGGATGAGTIIYVIIRLLLTKITSKNTQTLDGMFNVDALSQKVAEKMAGKTLNIDVTAVTEKALKKLSKQLDVKITAVEDATNSYKHLLALIGGALSKLKALSPEEVKELTEAIQALESGYTPPDPEETMTVVLEPLTLDDDAEDTKFEGLD